MIFSKLNWNLDAPLPRLTSTEFTKWYIYCPSWFIWSTFWVFFLFHSFAARFPFIKCNFILVLIYDLYVFEASPYNTSYFFLGLTGDVSGGCLLEGGENGKIYENFYISFECSLRHLMLHKSLFFCICCWEITWITFEETTEDRKGEHKKRQTQQQLNSQPNFEQLFMPAPMCVLRMCFLVEFLLQQIMIFKHRQKIFRNSDAHSALFVASVCIRRRYM